MQPIKVFCSYAPQDKNAVDKLERHLSILVHHEQIELWHVGKILPGADGERERVTQLKAADIILLIVSSDYIASPQCYKVEATRAVRMAEVGIAHVRRIPYRHVMDEEAVFHSCPNLLRDGKFVRDWPDKDKPLHQICQDIDALVSEAYRDRPSREANRKNFGDMLDKPLPFPMPPLKRCVQEPEQSKQAPAHISEKKKSQEQSKQATKPAPQKKRTSRASSTKRTRKATGTVVQRATASKSLDFNLRRQQISRKFGKNRGILFLALFIIDVLAMPLTIRSWSDSWLLVGLVCFLSLLIFSWGTLTTGRFLPILLSLLFAGAWGSLILRAFTWPLASWVLFCITCVIIIIACAHYFLFRKR